MPVGCLVCNLIVTIQVLKHEVWFLVNYKRKIIQCIGDTGSRIWKRISSFSISGTPPGKEIKCCVRIPVKVFIIFFIVSVKNFGRDLRKIPCAEKFHIIRIAKNAAWIITYINILFHTWFKQLECLGIYRCSIDTKISKITFINSKKTFTPCTNFNILLCIMEPVPCSISNPEFRISPELSSHLWIHNQISKFIIIIRNRRYSDRIYISCKLNLKFNSFFNDQLACLIVKADIIYSNNSAIVIPEPCITCYFQNRFNYSSLFKLCFFIINITILILHNRRIYLRYNIIYYFLLRFNKINLRLWIRRYSYKEGSTWKFIFTKFGRIGIFSIIPDSKFPFLLISVLIIPIIQFYVERIPLNFKHL